MRFNPEEYRKRAREYFEQAWHRGPEVITPPGREQEHSRLQYRKAVPHPIFEMVNRLRETYLSLGFEEICNPVIVEGEIGAGMGVTSLSAEEFHLMTSHPRSCIALPARAAGVLAIDSPFFGLVIDIDGILKETRKVKLMGFTGKLLVHPRHVEPVNQVFAPSKEEIQLAERVIKGYEEARAKGLGATSIGGRMIDFGSYRRAANLKVMAEKIAEREKRKTG